MGTSKKKKKKLPKSLRKGALPRSVDEVLAAGIGALGKAKKKGDDSFDALVQRGEDVTRKGGDAARGALSDVEAAVARIVEDARAQAGGAADSVQDRFEAVVGVALGTLGVAGRQDVAALRAKIDALQSRLGALVETDSEAPPSSSVTRYEVLPHLDGWAIRKPGGERATAVVGTKKEAVRDARKLAKVHVPSELTIRKADGSVADVVTYDAE